MKVYLGPNGVREQRIVHLQKDPFVDMRHETIERKGAGHPDSLSDALASRVSQAYSRHTLENFGAILHHQIDKLMVIGGRTEVTWGGGKFVDPIRIIVAGRASTRFGKSDVPVVDIVNGTIRSYFAELFPLVDFENDVVVENALTNYAGPGTIKESSGAIAQMFTPTSKEAVRGYEALVANDTSYCVSYAPLSPLERAVLYVENTLNAKEMKLIRPWLGTDIKIMAVRNDEELDVTMCIPQIAAYVPSLDEYVHNLESISQVVGELFGEFVDTECLTLSINTKDDYERKNVYLTVSGASLSGDIGVVGRGNRVNGLITSARPMSLEGTSGKNPKYYSGFIYALLTRNIANTLLASTGQNNVVEAVSQNGGPLLAPWRICVTSLAPTSDINDIVLQECKNIPKITNDFVYSNTSTS